MLHNRFISGWMSHIWSCKIADTSTELYINAPSCNVLWNGRKQYSFRGRRKRRLGWMTEGLGWVEMRAVNIWGRHGARDEHDNVEKCWYTRAWCTEINCQHVDRLRVRRQRWSLYDGRCSHEYPTACGEQKPTYEWSAGSTGAKPQHRLTDDMWRVWQVLLSAWSSCHDTKNVALLSKNIPGSAFALKLGYSLKPWCIGHSVRLKLTTTKR